MSDVSEPRAGITVYRPPLRLYRAIVEIAAWHPPPDTSTQRPHDQAQKTLYVYRLVARIVSKHGDAYASSVGETWLEHYCELHVAAAAMLSQADAYEEARSLFDEIYMPALDHWLDTQGCALVSAGLMWPGAPEEPLPAVAQRWNDAQMAEWERHCERYPEANTSVWEDNILTPEEMTTVLLAYWSTHESR